MTINAGVQSATRAAMEKLTATLNNYGLTTNHIVGVNIYLRKMEHFKIVNQVYKVRIFSIFAAELLSIVLS